MEFQMSVPLAIEIDCVGPTNGLDISGDYSELQEATSVETLECFMMSLLIHHPQSDMGYIISFQHSWAYPCLTSDSRCQLKNVGIYSNMFSCALLNRNQGMRWWMLLHFIE